MDENELIIQKKIISIFQELQNEIDNNYSKTNALGWQQRNELISHVNSEYGNHEKLNNKRNEWKKELEKGKVLKWLNDLFSQQRDLFGYFENYEQIINEIKGFRELAISTEKYEVAKELSIWEDKLMKNN
jgi:hypothetical protein